MNNESFDYEGVFTFQPEGKSCYGHLKYLPDNGLVLELYNLHLKYSRKFVGLISGKIYGEPYSCTLLNVNINNGKSIFDNDGGTYSIDKCTVQYAFLQKRFTNFEQIKFHEMQIFYSNLREWFNRPSIFTKFTEHEEHTNFKKIESIKGNLNEKFDFKVGFHNNGTFSAESFELFVKQSVSFSIICKDKEDLDSVGEFMKVNYAVSKFFMFIQGSYVTEEGTYCIDESKNIHAKLTLYQNHLATPKKFDRDTLFEFHFIPEIKLERLLKNWIKKYEEMPDFFKTYFENISNDSLHSIDRFENLLQSFLYYFNYKFEDFIKSKEDYAEFFESMLPKLNSDEKKFVNQFRGMGNLMSNPKILHKVLSEIPFWKDSESLRIRTVKNILEIRRKIQHATSNKDAMLMADADSMAHNMTGIVKSLILKEIGYDDSKGDKVIQVI